MQRLDFSSVMTIIRHYISPDHGMSQGELLDELFDSLHAESKEPIIFDGASINRWLKGTERVSPIISQYYLKRSNREKLAEDIEQYILPLMYDSDMVVQELYRLTVQDATISDRQKKKLLKDYPCDTERATAHLIATLLCFAMERTFVRRTPGNTALLTAGVLSPASADFILNNRVPVPCRYFCGRDAELSTLHNLLNEHGKVFISGIPGIGKSELAKTYAKQHHADYTNIVHLYYTSSLHEDIIRMDFVDDLPDDTAAVRYQRHACFLRTLKEDTLLIVDNFNVTAEEDVILAEVMAYRCKVLFTTRCRFEEYPTLELLEISDKQTLLHLMSCYYSNVTQHQDALMQIIETVHSHTLAIELAARLLETGMLEPEALLTKLQAEKASLNISDTVSIHKDGHSTKATYYRHIHMLFALYQLATAEQNVMRSLCFTPPTGISARLLAKWLRQDSLNTINDLIEMGFVQSQPGRILALHPLMQEIAFEELKPSVRNCRTILDSLHEICLRHGEESPQAQLVMQTIEGIIMLIIKNDSAYYLRFVEDAIPFAEKYRCQRGIVALVHEMESLLSDNTLGTSEDRALLLSYQAMCVDTPAAAIRLQEQAITLLPEITIDNALLATNLHANLGGMYRESGNYIKAREHMEEAIFLLRKHDLLAYHDSIPQVVNYAMLLSEIGQVDKAIAVLEQIAALVQEHNSAVCLDVATIHEAMGNTYLMTGNIEQAAAQHLSRLGRNYVMTGQYTDFYFPSKGVRYIAINDNVDTLNGESELAPFLNILNEMHARQTSKKVKAALHTKFANGLHIGAYAPIGYMRDPEQKGHLLIDPDTRWIVEQIFDLALHGMGAAKITHILHQDRVPTPGYINYQRYGTFAHIYAGQTEEKAFDWSIGQVKSILKNEVYIGHSIHNQQTNISFKNKKKVRKPVEEWFRVENTHEAIISEDDFRRVQEMIDTRRRSQKDGELQLFAGLIKCADCGWSLGHGRRKTKHGFDGYYHCSKNGQGLHQCSMHYIREDVLCAYVLSRLQYWSQQAQQNEEKLLKRLMGATDRERSAAKKKKGTELRKAEKRKAEIDSLFARMYEDWSTGRITEYNFNMLSEKYQTEQQELDEKIQQLRASMEADQQSVQDAEKWIELIRKYTNITELTADLLNALIEKITVHEATKDADGNRMQEVEIYYRFIGKIE